MDATIRRLIFLKNKIPGLELIFSKDVYSYSSFKEIFSADNKNIDLNQVSDAIYKKEMTSSSNDMVDFINSFIEHLSSN